MIAMKNTKLSEALLHRKAKKQAKEIRSFYINLMCYCIVIPILIAVNLKLTPDHYWFQYSMLGWGTGVIIHGLSAFNCSPILGRNWEERKIQELIEKEEYKDNHLKNQ